MLMYQNLLLLLLRRGGPHNCCCISFFFRISITFQFKSWSVTDSEEICLHRVPVRFRHQKPMEGAMERREGKGEREREREMGVRSRDFSPISGYLGLKPISPKAYVALMLSSTFLFYFGKPNTRLWGKLTNFFIVSFYLGIFSLFRPTKQALICHRGSSG